jgi:diguanylate cyclase (GGDEF)-like protein
VRVHDWGALAVPSSCTLVAVGVLVACGVGNGQEVAIALAGAAVCAAVARTFVTFHELRQLLETKRLALTDELTGQPNRRALLARLEQAVAAGEEVGLLLVDLDHFKELNDTLGHPTGDLLLREIGPRLEPALLPGDLLARLGGDEFALVLAGPVGDGDLEAAGARVRQALDLPFEVDGIPAQVEASVGAAAYPRHAEDVTTLLKRADVAMYVAKRERTGTQVYSAARDRHSRERIALVGELRHGLDRGELELHFQPQVGLHTGELVGFEALARWRHPDRGLLRPAAFLPTVEQTSVMRPFTDALILQALRAAAEWRAAGIGVAVAVNVGAPNLLDPGFARRVGEILEAGEAPPGQLRVEVTENAVMVDLDRALRVLHELRELGVTLSLDDFGVGHSSLAPLKHLPVDELKIDRSFVGSMTSDHRDAAIVGAVATMASSLGLTTVAEGVETPEAYAAVRATGWDRAQGFVIARPVPGHDLLAWAAAWMERRPKWARPRVVAAA